MCANLVTVSLKPESFVHDTRAPVSIHLKGEQHVRVLNEMQAIPPSFPSHVFFLEQQLLMFEKSMEDMARDVSRLDLWLDSTVSSESVRGAMNNNSHWDS
jgi:hypothetical protein